MALPSSSRNGARVLWITLHTAEGSRTKESLYAYFNGNQNASSHVGIDGYGISPVWVPRERAAWTLLNGNPVSMNAELCGFARWTRAQWLSTGWVDGCWNPRQMVRNAAAWALQECRAFGIGPVYIGTSGVRNCARGIIDHDDYSKGTGNGDHWDIGENFPWDVFFADMGLADTGDDMFSDQDRATLQDLKAYLVTGGAYVDQAYTGDLPPGISPRSVFGLTLDSNKALSAIYTTLGMNISQVLADVHAKLSELHGVVVSGSKRDGRLNVDLGYVLETQLAQLENARAQIMYTLNEMHPKDPTSEVPNP